MDDESKGLVRMLNGEPMPSPNNELKDNLKNPSQFENAVTTDRGSGRGISGVTIRPLPTGQLIHLSSMSEALPSQSRNILCPSEGMCSSATAPGVTGLSTKTQFYPVDISSIGCTVHTYARQFLLASTRQKPVRQRPMFFLA